MKKIIALLTTLIMTLIFVFTYFPTTAYAEGKSRTLYDGELLFITGWATEGELDTIIVPYGYSVVIAGDTPGSYYDYEEEVTIICKGNNTVTLQNVFIDNEDTATCILSFSGTGNTLILKEENKLVNTFDEDACVRVNSGTELTIQGDGSLYCMGAGGAAIGGDYEEQAGTIIIEDEVSISCFSIQGAAIGSGGEASGGVITIRGNPTIDATSYGNSAAIGGGANGDGGVINIGGGTITANNTYFLYVYYVYGAAIGGGQGGSGGVITISGGTIVAQGGKDSAAIGGGYEGSSGTIMISGGTVFANGGVNYPSIGISDPYTDIGSGKDAEEDGSITITNFANVFFSEYGCDPEPTVGTHTYIASRSLTSGKLYGYQMPDGWVTAGAYLCYADVITYSANNGTSSTTEVIQVASEPITIKDSTTFTRTGYNLTGWNTESDGDGTDYDIGEEATFSSDTTLYALWEAILATDITIDQSDFVINVNDTATLTATITPSDALNQTPTWKSSDTSVATIDSDGLITAVAEGTATITATADGCTDTITVDVVLTQIDYTNSMYLYDTMQIYTGLEPNNSSNANVEITISDTDILTIDSDFIVTAAGIGTAKVDVRTNDSVNTTYTITVSARAVTGVQLIPEEAAMETGDTLELTAVVSPDNATDKSVTWESSDTSVATVDTSGKITAVSKGTATITATSGSCSDTCSVTVTQPITSVNITDSTLDLTEGGTYTLTCELLPSNAETETIYWTSSDTDIASVDTNGKVTAKSLGSATITATAGGFSDTCDVTVSKKAVTGVSLNYSENTLFIGDWFTLTATISPADATYKAVSWSSSDTSVATVSSSGVVEAIDEGTATIRATADGMSAECKVTVNYNSVTSVTLSDTSISMYLGESEALTTTVLPADAANPTVTWTSSDTSVATVTNGVVQAVGEGSCTITAEAEGMSDICSVSVSRIYVTSVDLNYTSISMYLGDSETLSATVYPADATYPSVTWESSDTSIATVTNGVVNAVGEGSCTITATADGVSDTCSVYVGRVAVTSVDLSYSSLSMYVDDQRILTADVSPSDATYPDVTWTSSDESIVTVNSNGVVTAVSVGSATITATADGVSDSCAVTVNYDPAVEVDDVEFIVENSSVTVMYVGDTLQLSVAVTPSDATDTSVTWASSDTSILTVSDAGLVTALSVGDATVTVTAQGNASASYKITVKALDDESEEEDVPEDDGDGSSAGPTATPEVVFEEESDVYLTFDLDVSNLGEDAKYIQLPNGEVIDIEGKDVISVSILASDLNGETLEIVTLDEDMVALGSVELSATDEKSGLPWFIILMIILGAMITGAGGMLLIVRVIVSKK